MYTGPRCRHCKQRIKPSFEGSAIPVHTSTNLRACALDAPSEVAEWPRDRVLPYVLAMLWESRSLVMIVLGLLGLLIYRLFYA